MNIKENILAIPSKDGLRYESLNLMKSGIAINFEYMLGSEGVRNLTSEADLLVVEGERIKDLERFTVALLRPIDIVKMVAAGEIPVGIAGMDTVEEYRLSWRGGSWNENRVQTLLPLGIGRCRLVLAAPQESGFKTAQEFQETGTGNSMGIPVLEQFDGRTIATSYPRLTSRYFIDAYGSSGTDMMTPPKFELREFSGSVEAAPALGLADAIADLVETGGTIEANGLREIDTIFESQAVLITNTQNKKGDDPFVDNVRDAIFRVLLNRGNPDAIARQQSFEAMIASFR